MYTSHRSGKLDPNLHSASDVSSRMQKTLDLKCAIVTEILFALVCAFLRRFARFLWGFARVFLGWNNARLRNTRSKKAPSANSSQAGTQAGVFPDELVVQVPLSSLYVHLGSGSTSGSLVWARAFGVVRCRIRGFICVGAHGEQLWD